MGKVSYMPVGTTIKLTPEEVTAMQSGSSTQVINEPIPEAIDVSTNLYKDVDEIKAEIMAGSVFHKRPLSDKEYDEFLNKIKSSQGKMGEPVYSYEKLAIAIVIKENYNKFRPQVVLDPIIDSVIESALTIDSRFKSLYEESLEKHRDLLTTRTASELPDLYSDDEKLMLKSLGLSFLDYSPNKEILTPDTMPSKEVVSYHFTHPMLRYGLISKRN